jgi:aldose 1-epimerase
VGRYCNRIAHGKFSLKGHDIKLSTNQPPNHLHGGFKGFDKVLWSSHVQGNAVTLSYTSRDGEEGYPGEVNCSVTYELTDSNELIVEYRATTTRPTPINLTNHSYFNLSGQSGDILDHEVVLNADSYTPVDKDSIPTGEIVPVRGTPFDLTSNVHLGRRFAQLSDQGFDHNFCVNGTGKRLVGRVEHPASGRVLEVHSTMPGVQLYTGNFIPDTCVGKGGAVYKKHSGVCLETQYYPDSVNKPNFPSCIFGPANEYQHTTVYRFTTL